LGWWFKPHRSGEGDPDYPEFYLTNLASIITMRA